MDLQHFYNDVMSFAAECGMKEKKNDSRGNTVVRNNATQYSSNKQLIDNKRRWKRQ